MFNQDYGGVGHGQNLQLTGNITTQHYQVAVKRVCSTSHYNRSVGRKMEFYVTVNCDNEAIITTLNSRYS